MGEMYRLMPSEIARLVLGYLKNVKCQKTVGMFLHECPHLKEYVDCLLQGWEYSTSINGKTLLDILHEYSTLTSNVGIETHPEMCARSLLLSTRKEQAVTLVSVGCGQESVCEMRQSGCQTSPPVHPELSFNTEIQQTPIKRSVVTSFLTPICRPVDLYSSPSSLVKSVLFNFQSPNVTPLKNSEFDGHLLDCRTNSPRRKDPLPRKRLYSPGSNNSPSSSSATKKRNVENTESTPFAPVVTEAENAVSTSCLSERIDITALIDNMLQNSVLHERIAANINDVIGGDESAHPVLSISEASCDTVPEDLVKNIVNRTESDPAFEAFLQLCNSDKQDSNSRDSHLSQIFAVEAEKSEELICEVPVDEDRRRTGEKETETRPGEGNSNFTTNPNVDENVTYLVPMSINEENAPVYHIVLGTSSGEHYEVDQTQLKAGTSIATPARTETQFTTLSPGQLYTFSSIETSTDIQKKTAKPKNVVRKCNAKTKEPLKESFLRRHYAVKSLNFGPASVPMAKSKDRVSRKSKETLILSPGTVRPRLTSLIRTVENLSDKTSGNDCESDDLQYQNNQNKDLPQINITTRTSSKNLEKKGPQSLRGQNTQSKQKSSDKLESDGRKTQEKEICVEKMAQEVLCKMNVDQFLSEIQYVD